MLWIFHGLMPRRLHCVSVCANIAFAKLAVNTLALAWIAVVRWTIRGMITNHRHSELLVHFQHRGVRVWLHNLMHMLGC